MKIYLMRRPPNDRTTTISNAGDDKFQTRAQAGYSYIREGDVTVLELWSTSPAPGTVIRDAVDNGLK